MSHCRKHAACTCASHSHAVTPSPVSRSNTPTHEVSCLQVPVQARRPGTRWYGSCQALLAACKIRPIRGHALRCMAQNTIAVHHGIGTVFLWVYELISMDLSLLGASACSSAFSQGERPPWVWAIRGDRESSAAGWVETPRQDAPPGREGRRGASVGPAVRSQCRPHKFHVQALRLRHGRPRRCRAGGTATGPSGPCARRRGSPLTCAGSPPAGVS